MRRHRGHSTAFKRQVVEEYLAGAALHALAKTHDICRNLIRVWIHKYGEEDQRSVRWTDRPTNGEFDEGIEAANTLHEYEARSAALERLVGRQALEIELINGAANSRRSQRSASTSAVVGPRTSPSNGDAR